MLPVFAGVKFMFVIIFLCVLFLLFLVLYSVCLFSRPYLYPWTKSIEFVFTVQIMIPFDETSDLFSIFIQCNKLVGMINRAMDLGRHILYYSLQSFDDYFIFSASCEPLKQPVTTLVIYFEGT